MRRWGMIAILLVGGLAFGQTPLDRTSPTLESYCLQQTQYNDVLKQYLERRELFERLSLVILDSYHRTVAYYPATAPYIAGVFLFMGVGSFLVGVWLTLKFADQVYRHFVQAKIAKALEIYAEKMPHESDPKMREYRLAAYELMKKGEI